LKFPEGIRALQRALGDLPPDVRASSAKSKNTRDRPEHRPHQQNYAWSGILVVVDPQKILIASLFHDLIQVYIILDIHIDLWMGRE
jgi:hypothetical protein